MVAKQILAATSRCPIWTKHFLGPRPAPSWWTNWWNSEKSHVFWSYSQREIHDDIMISMGKKHNDNAVRLLRGLPSTLAAPANRCAFHQMESPIEKWPPFQSGYYNWNIEIWLVVEPPLWKIWKSVGVTIPNIWKNKKCSKPPNRNLLHRPRDIAGGVSWCLMDKIVSYY